MAPKFYFIFSVYLMGFVFDSTCRSIFARTESTLSNFSECFKASGYSQLILPFVPDPQNTTFLDIVKAKNAGLKVHIVYSPCRNETPKAVSRYLRTIFGIHVLDEIWLFGSDGLYPQNPLCSWKKYSGSSNCQYAKQLLSTLKQDGFNVAVLANGYFWEYYFGTWESCEDIGKTGAHLWWFPLQVEQDGKPDFQGFRYFGGWDKPTMKTFAASYICQEDMLQMYYPDQIK